MKSKVKFDIDFTNEPIIIGAVSQTEDLRDKIAGKFIQKFLGLHESCIALLSFTGDKGLETEFTIRAVSAPQYLELVESMTIPQLGNLKEAIELELIRREHRSKKDKEGGYDVKHIMSPLS